MATVKKLLFHFATCTEPAFHFVHRADESEDTAGESDGVSLLSVIQRKGRSCAYVKTQPQSLFNMT